MMELVLSMQIMLHGINAINIASSVPILMNATMGGDKYSCGSDSSYWNVRKKERKAVLSVSLQSTTFSQGIMNMEI